MNIFNIQKWLGHADPRMTMEHDAHLSSEYAEDIHGAPPVRVGRNPERPPMLRFAKQSVGGSRGTDFLWVWQERHRVGCKKLEDGEID